MASLYQVVLLFLPLVTMYFQFEVSSERMLGTQCINDSDCKDDKMFCWSVCTCKTAFFKGSNSVCIPRIHPNKACNKTDNSCAFNSICTKSVCTCSHGFYSNQTSCIQSPLSGLESLTVQATVPKSMQDTTRNPTGVEVSHSSGSTVQTTDFNTTIGNSAVTMAVVEILTLTICFMLAYLDVLK